MINHPCSFYAFYAVNEGEFYYNNADNVYLLYKLNENKKSKSISINFRKELNNDTVKLMYRDYQGL